MTGEGREQTLRTRVALVTGSGRRLGAALAVALGRAGYDVAIHYSASAEQARQTEARIASAGRRAVSFPADLRRPGEIGRLFRDVERSFGRLDCLVNSAAIFPLSPWDELTPEIWNEVLTVNLTAPFLRVKAAEPLLRAVGGGNIVNILSLGAFEAWIDRPANGVAKAGLLKFTQSLARALAPDILVNAVAPEDVSDVVLLLARTRYITGQCKPLGHRQTSPTTRSSRAASSWGR